MYGISDLLLNEFKKIKKKYNVDLNIFGSRARGDYKYNSDIDIVILNKEISEHDKYAIMNDFDKINSEYKIDLVFIQDVKNEEFLNSINAERKKI